MAKIGADNFAKEFVFDLREACGGKENLPDLFDSTLNCIADNYEAIDKVNKKRFLKSVIGMWWEYVSVMKSHKALSPEVRLKLIYEKIDERFRGIKTSCKSGCSFCCHIPVAITGDEAIVLKELAKNIKHMKYGCAFLKDKKCTIYEHRPILCRTHNAVTESKFCDIVTYPNMDIPTITNLEVELLKSAAFHVSGNFNMEKVLNG